MLYEILFYYFILLLVCASGAKSQMFDLQNLDGYTIIANKTIRGYLDSNGRLIEEFEGCEYNRVIVFDDDTIVTCASYHIHYAFRPRVVVLVHQFLPAKLVIDGTLIDLK